jgi:nucleotide-binding universal stress UspA family protein
MVGTDGSDTSLRAVDRAAALAADSAASLLIVTAYHDESAEVAPEADNALKSDAFQVAGSNPAETMLREAAVRARAAGVSNVETLAIEGSPVDVLDQAVLDWGAELLVVGNVGLNTIAGRILGSVPQSVARRAGVDVLIVHTT